MTMKTKTLPILPCPFCGQQPCFTFIAASEAGPELDGSFYALSCYRKPNLCPASPYAIGDTKAQAIAAWNTRAPNPKAEAAFAACRSIAFATANAMRHGGDYSLNDLLAADKLAREAIRPTAKKGGAS